MQSRNPDTAWLKAENWQSVLEDPETLPEPIRTHLETENTRAEEWLGGPDARAWIIDELKATIRDQDDSVPVIDGSFRYWQRFVAGAEHPDFLRQGLDSTHLEVLLSGDQRAAGFEYYDVGAADHSPDHRWFAVTEDTQGAERYVLTVFDTETGEWLPDQLADCRGDFEWGALSDRLIYTRLDENQRPSSVWCHRLGTSQSDDQCVFRQTDAGRFIGLGKTSSQTLITIDSHDHQTNQAFILDASLDHLEPIPVTAWIPGLEYELEQIPEGLLIRSNHAHPDFALFHAPLPSANTPLDPVDWTLLWAPEPGTLFSDYEVLKEFWVFEISTEGVPQYWISSTQIDAFSLGHALQLESDIHDAHLEPLPDFSRDRIRMRFSTPAQPPRVLEIDLRTGDIETLKISAPPNGHTDSNYVVQRAYGISGDGERIPMTLTYHRELELNADTPVLLTGYGAYGMSLTPGFSASRRTLLTRGVLHVTAHVRGGMENGYHWYTSGRMADKDNSFNDLIGAAESLIRDGFTRAGRIVLHGGSAGGLLVGTAVMRRPELFAGVIADVPFVDVLDTMLDADLPLTPPEWPEWGNPAESEDARRRIRQYAPTEIAAPITYPCILATAGLTDPRVTYWEPARWIASLNAQASGGPFLLYTELHAGHGGPSGRYAGLDDLARIYQTVMKLFDLPKDSLYGL